MEQGSLPAPAGDLTVADAVFFGALSLLCLFYLGVFILTGGVASLGDLSGVRLLQKLALLAVAFGLVYLWSKRGALMWVDYQIAYAPFVAWALGFWVGGAEKGMSSAYVELQIVALLTVAYLVRFPLVALLRGIGAQIVAGVLLGVLLVTCFMVPFLMPPFPD
jgi:hypothetical protein